MDAYYRRTGEDRATEILATALRAVPAFVAQLADRLGLPRADAYEIGAQIGSGPIIDLEIKARSGDGHPAWLLWSEHKVADPLKAEQLIDEDEAMAARACELTRRVIGCGRRVSRLGRRCRSAGGFAVAYARRFTASNESN